MFHLVLFCKILYDNTVCLELIFVEKRGRIVLMEPIKVDVLIPTYRPDERAVRLVKRLLKQSYPVNKIYILNTDVGVFPDEFETLSEKIVVTHIPPEEFDHGGTRHMGATMSQAEILIYMTQDALPVDEFLVERLAEVFQDPSIGAAYGRQMPSADCQIIERYTRSFNYPGKSRVKSKEDIEELGIKTYFCSNVCAAYRKSVYEALGGFERKTIFNEDMIFAGKLVQAGYKIAYVAEARVIHSHNYSCIQQMKRNFDLAVSQKEHPEIFEGLPSESEGIRLVKQTAVYLIRNGRFWMIPSLVLKSGFKYLGYKLGQHYKLLPRSVVLKCTMNQRYWKHG